MRIESAGVNQIWVREKKYGPKTTMRVIAAVDHLNNDIRQDRDAEKEVEGTISVMN